MTFNISISDSRDEIINTWKTVFGETIGVSFFIEDYISFKSNNKLDAIVMLQRHALEEFGGMPAVNESLIINTSNKNGMPNWVVTTSPFIAQLKEQINSNGRVELVDSTDLKTRLDQHYITFFRIFKAIEDFNKSKKNNIISNLGIYLRTINFGKNSKAEAEAVLKAYTEHLFSLNLYSINQE